MFTQDELEPAAIIQEHGPWNAVVQGPEFLRPLRHHPPCCTAQSETLTLLQTLGLRLLVGQSPQFVAVVQRPPKLAHCDATVLISGETGTGKEVCARTIGQNPLTEQE